MVTLNIVPVDDPPLITVYNNRISTPEDAIRSQLIQGIGTVVPE